MLIKDAGYRLGNREMLEYIHCTLQEAHNGIIDDHMIRTSLELVEEMREPYIRTSTTGESR